MGDIHKKKQKTVKRIERLSAIFASVAVLPAIRGIELRTKLGAIPMPYSKRLPVDHIIHKTVQDLADRINIKVDVEIADPQKPLYGAFTYATARKHNIGDVTELRIVFMGSPLRTPEGALFARAIIAHELGHVEQINSKLFTFNRANLQMAVASTFMLAGLSAFAPAYLPFTLAGCALTFALTAFNQWEQRCNEFLADLRGAKLLGSYEEMGAALAYIHHVHSTWEKLEQKNDKETTLSRIFNHHIFSSHPPVEKRIAALKQQSRITPIEQKHQKPG